MAKVKLETVTVYTSHQYSLQLNQRMKVKQIADYLSNYETHVETTTLELAYPVRRRQRLHDVDMRPGDRLLMFTQATREAELPAPLRAGDKILKFKSGSFELQTHSRRGIVVGKPDDSQQAVPDVDLRYFVAPDALDFISRRCLQLNFDEAGQVWYASRLGQTRVMFNEYELGDERIPLDSHQVIRFYRASDDPRHTKPLAEIVVTVEAVAVSQDRPDFMTGDYPVKVCVGIERGRQLLCASEQWHIGNMMERLASFNSLPFTQDTRFYLLRLVPPKLSIADLNLYENSFLYASLNQHYAQNFLILHDIHHSDSNVVVSVGTEDDEKRLGCRARRDVADTSIDVDLYDALIIHGHDLRIFQTISRYQARIFYRSAGNTWWIRAEDHASTPIFINNSRVSSTAPVQLISGDVLTLGPSVGHYYARLELEITSKAN